MSSQLELFAPTVPACAPLTGIKHICLPDFSLACGITFLQKPDGDRVLFGRPANWRDVTCNWCRALGRDYCRHAYAAFRTAA